MIKPDFSTCNRLYRPIFGAEITVIKPDMSQNGLRPEHATDFLAIPAENVYRNGQSEAKITSDAPSPQAGSVQKGGLIPSKTGHWGEVWRDGLKRIR
ncbi:MAG: hypothetical protein CVV32_05005 [Methanomicrobiales archaeon HGW-Methanomicrobiales-3]|jgi:hypothetical protein|nr:MAG: hypothetical protein CVV32_05005 [Methanomicrobiales archaeon HGW-Methanomicrobiales-3]